MRREQEEKKSPVKCEEKRCVQPSPCCHHLKMSKLFSWILTQAVQWNEYLDDAGEKAGGTKQDNGCHLHPGVRARLIEENGSGEAGNGNGDETTTEDEKSPSASSLWSILEIVAWRRCGDEPGQ